MRKIILYIEENHYRILKYLRRHKQVSLKKLLEDLYGNYHRNNPKRTAIESLRRKGLIEVRESEEYEGNSILHKHLVSITSDGLKLLEVLESIKRRKL